MFAIATCAVLIALALAVVRAVGTLAILLLIVVGFLTGRPEWIDIGLTYALLNLIGTLAILKYFRHGDLAHDAEEDAKK